MKLCVWLLALTATTAISFAAETTNLVEILRRFQAELDAREGRTPAGVKVQPRTRAQPPVEVQTVVPPVEYRLRVGDRVKVEVVGEPGMSADHAEVAGDGTIELPIVGPISVSGKTTAEAMRVIREILERDYLVNPRVLVKRLESGARTEGPADPETAKTPRSAVLPPPARPPPVVEPTVPPSTGVEPTVPPSTGVEPVVPPSSVVEPAVSSWTPVEPTVPPSTGVEPAVSPSLVAAPASSSGYFTVTNQVARPGNYPWTGEGITLRSALELAGGPTAQADLRRVRVRRLIGGERRELEVDLDRPGEARRGGSLLLKPGDEVEVPAKK